MLQLVALVGQRVRKYVSKMQLKKQQQIIPVELDLVFSI